MDFRKERHVVDLLFVIALLFLFAFSAIMLIALGADVYQKNVDTTQINYDRRTASAYLIQKVRQADAEGSVRTDTLNGTPALVLTKHVGDRDYATWLYLFDGSLREQLLRADMTPDPAAGQEILPLHAMEAEMTDAHLLSVHLELASGESEDFCLGIRSEAEKEDAS
ncbi:MAG: DUF4860 domain-containing protein [Lachnospiraceae bacterium]|nr:DUF4860 domain-containing protein [Lachnospiraceae bacterium]